MSQRVTLTCTKCGKQTPNTITDDAYLSFTIERTNAYTSSLGQSFKFPYTLDLCRECFIEFEGWLVEKK
jgi:hypothetical protein